MIFCGAAVLSLTNSQKNDKVKQNIKALEEHVESHEKLNISVIGVLIFDKDIDTELFKKAVGSVRLRGKLIAADEVKNAVGKMN